MMDPDARREKLRASLERDLDHAREISRHEREQRDQYTSKIRFGLVAINAASLVTVSNLGSLLPHANEGHFLAAAAFFLFGTALAGYSVATHQTHLIEVAGAANARAIELSNAVALADHPVGSPEFDRLGLALESRRKNLDEIYKPGLAALRLQWLSMGAWIGGAGSLGPLELAARAPALSEWIT